MFTATKDTSGERRKAINKNHNLPILQEMYHGDPETQLHCLATKLPAFIQKRNYVTGEVRILFTIDFDHIRQAYVPGFTGNSADKLDRDPSEVFRGFRLDEMITIMGTDIKPFLLEMMCCVPMNSLHHDAKTQDSTEGDIVLNNFPKNEWPWVLLNEENYNYFTEKHDIKIMSYAKFINHLNDIKAAPIRTVYELLK